VPNSLWRFCPQRKKDSKGDYHKVFNSQNFVGWWRDQLLPNLSGPSIVYMDNAKYHKTYDASVPKLSKTNKAPLQQWMRHVSCEYDDIDLKKVLVKKCRAFIVEKFKYECVQLAENQSHRVVFTAPCYSDLQPIELVWALVKGNVGRQYSVNTTLDLVLQRLDKEFEDLAATGSEVIQKIIDNCAEKAMALYKEEEEQEKQSENDKNDEAASGSESSSDESQSGPDEAADATMDASDTEGEDEDIVEL
jgi:transposase